jgi:hypothetical protein
LSLPFFKARSKNCEKRILAWSCPSVRMEQFGFHWTDFDWTWYLTFCRKSVGKIQSDCNPTRITGTLREEVFTFMTESDLILLRKGNILDESCRENRNTHFMFNNFFPTSAPFLRKCRKMWWRPRGHKWRHNMAHTRCILDKQGYMNARTCIRPRTWAHACARKQICNIYWFSMATMIREGSSILRYTYVVLLAVSIILPNVWLPSCF